MSIRIIKEQCIACGKCLKVCPGNLLYKDNNGKAFIRYPEECWGCTACLKECPIGAIQYYLGIDLGGNGGYLYTKTEEETLNWHVVDSNGNEKIVSINRKESNKY
jgi:adenylylsulfate reductase subunit B